jgi:hypothetical protein
MYFLFSDNITAEKFSKSLDKMLKAVEIMSEQNSRMTITALMAFLFIGINQEKIINNRMTLQEISKDFGIPYSSFMRHMELLDDKSGLALVKRYVDNENPKTRIPILTEKGVLLLRTIDSALS